MTTPEAGMMVTPSVRLVRPLGEGGMGAVWVADHVALRTQVVVKFIASELSASADAQERFAREAAAAAQVKSPHVVQTFDHGVTADGLAYIVMELLEGRDLGHHLDDAKGPLAPALTLEIVTQLARALERAHERGIVHRDIKPGNVFLCDAGSGEVFVKLLDFGIAKGVTGPGLDSHTKTGSMVGSPFYMSPEQVLGSRDIDHRTDLWSVGIVAYECLTGQKPFDAETVGGLAIKIHSAPLPRLTDVTTALPPAVDAWFAKACSRDLATRFRSAKEMAEALATALDSKPSRPVDVPRLSTGSRDVSPSSPTLAASHPHATTESGIERVAEGPSRRPRKLATLALVAVGLGAATVAAVVTSAKREPPAAGIVSSAHEASVAATPPPAAVDTLKVETPEPPRVETPTPKPAAPAEKAAVRSTPHAAPKAAPVKAAPPSAPDTPSARPAPPTSPATPPAPAPNGHDIF